MKLLKKLLLIILSVFIVSLIFEVWLAFTQTRNEIEKTIQTQQMEITHQTMDKIDRFLYERYTDIQSMASDPSIQNLIKTYNSLSVTNDSTPSSIEQANFSHRIKDLSVLTGPWDELFITNIDGDIISSTDDINIGKNISSEKENNIAFQKVLSSEKVYYSDLVLSDNSKQPTIIYSMPVRDELDSKRSIVGVIIGNLSWPVALEILQSTKVDVIELYNAKGFWIGDNHYDHIGNILKKNFSDVDVIKKALSGSEGSSIDTGTYHSYESLISYVNEKGYLDYKGNNWVMISQEPANKALFPAFRSAFIIVLTLVPIIIFSALIIFLSVLKIIKPIEALTQTTKDIAAGNLDKTVTVFSNDEIGILGESFNQMAAKLKEYQVSLEQKIKERTIELENAKKQLQTQLLEVEKMNQLMIGRELSMIALKKKLEELKEKIA